MHTYLSALGQLPEGEKYWWEYDLGDPGESHCPYAPMPWTDNAQRLEAFRMTTRSMSRRRSPRSSRHLLLPLHLPSYRFHHLPLHPPPFPLQVRLTSVPQTSVHTQTSVHLQTSVRVHTSVPTSMHMGRLVPKATLVPTKTSVPPPMSVRALAPSIPQSSPAFLLGIGFL